jgi:hypothetical protein
MSTRYFEAVRQFKVEYWKRVLEQCQGNLTHAAKAEGMNRTYLEKLVGQLGLRGYARPDVVRKPRPPAPRHSCSPTHESRPHLWGMKRSSAA